MSRLLSFSFSLFLSFAIATTGTWAPTIARGQSVVSEVTAASKSDTVATPTARQQAWLRATPEERILLAERLGEEGAAALAAKKGYRPMLTGEQKTVRQGFDQVYQAPDGRVVVVEAKGGSSPLGRGYGAEQGTSEWAVKAARETLRNGKASAAEQNAARSVLDAAEQGNLAVEVIRTRHVLGEPVVAVQESSATVSAAERELARGILHGGESTASPMSQGAASAVEGTEAVAKGAAAASKLATAAKVASVAGVAIDAGFRIHDGMATEKQFAAGEITQQQREVAHARNAAGMAGGWAGAWGGAELGAMGGGAAGTVVAPGPGTAVGGAVGGVAGGVAGYIGGEKAAEAGAEWAMNKVHAAGTTISDTASSAVGGVKRTWNWMCGR